MRFVICKTTVCCVKFFILVSILITPVTIAAQSTHNDGVNLDKIPPRIIRACCAFGYDFKLKAIPFVTIDQVISVDDLNEHHYMGNKNEGTGTIYTKKGGFIDIGHLRDQIDWTRYLYATILHNRGKGEVVLRLRKEAGRKTLHLNVPAQLDDSDCILLAGKIAYDFSLWHEISTWYGASTVPLISEKFSSFSVEDVYSNLLGIHVGMKTLHSKTPFNEAATKDPDVLTSSRPWIVPNPTNTRSDSVILDVPLLTSKGELLTNFYQFTIDLNYRFPVEEIFPDRNNKLINQNDFGVFLDVITDELETLEQNTLAEKK